MLKYQSVTTPEVKHDIPNFLTEIFFLNKYGCMKPYVWRKGNPLSKDWPKIVAIFRKLINTHNIAPEQLAWFLYKHKPTSIDAKSFGLMVWKVRKLFGKYSLDEICTIYSEMYRSVDIGVIIDDYKTPDGQKDGGNNLFSILSRMEKGAEEKERENRE